ncbi:GNAT family protein [soil metagenome]
MAWPEPLTLNGDYCTLEPLSLDHHDALVEAVKDGELWNLWYAFIPKPDDMKKEIIRRLDLQAKGSMLPFTVINRKTQEVIGMTTYCHTDSTNKRIEVGWTWYARSYQRTAINTECKLMLLRHAFEKLNCIAVAFRVDFLNHQSRKAVERLGARLEGIIRNYSLLSNGNPRDMCFYSVLPHEWPNVKANLTWLLTKPR